MKNSASIAAESPLYSPSTWDCLLLRRLNVALCSHSKIQDQWMNHSEVHHTTLFLFNSKAQSVILFPGKVCLKQPLSHMRGCGPPPSSSRYVESQQRTSSTSICLSITAPASWSEWLEPSREVMILLILSRVQEQKHLHAWVRSLSG